MPVQLQNVFPLPVPVQNFLYYLSLFVLIGGSIAGVAYALQARREAREGVDLTSEADMLLEFQRARDAGEMDDAEFRRVRDLLITGKGTQGHEHRDVKHDSGLEDRPPASPPPEHPTSNEPE